MEISRETFDAQRRPRFGTANPERMRLDFWEWMARERKGPQGARDAFNEPWRREDGPIWTMSRFGATETELPDGRAVFIGGEHEDYYDPDFCIFNDVVVRGPGDRLEIYGYPKDVFPPTDSHTSSLIGDRIFIVGCLGYPDDRKPGHTPVYTLDPVTYRIDPFPTTGEAPSWLFKHEAEVGSDGAISVKGGQVLVKRDGQCRGHGNFDDYTLDTRSGVWRRLTHRSWREYFVSREDGGAFPFQGVGLPENFHEQVEPLTTLLRLFERGRGEEVIPIQGCPITVGIRVTHIEVVVRGDLPQCRADQFVEAVCEVASFWAEHPCVAEQVGTSD